MHYEGGILKRSISCCYQMCCSKNVDVVGVATSPRRLILERTSRNLSSCFFLTAAKHSAIINLTCLSALPRHAPWHAQQNTDSSQNGVNNIDDNQAPLIKSDIKKRGGGGSGAEQDRAAELLWKPGWWFPSCWVHRCLSERRPLLRPLLQQHTRSVPKAE